MSGRSEHRPSTTGPSSPAAKAMTDRALVQRAIDLLDGRWTLPILTELTRGGRRYQDLHDALDGISYKVLTETLRRAERDGLIVRHLDGERIETATLYELTDLGRSLDAPVAAMATWANANWQSVEAARRHWDRLRRASG
jgi:DNA-binding HxlR family transcriptional regulator